MTIEAVAAANTFMAHHKDFIKGQDSQALIAYLGLSRNLDARLRSHMSGPTKSSFKKDGKLQLYSK